MEQQQQPIDDDLFFGGIDPGVHNLAVCVIDKEGEIKYLAMVDLARNKNGNNQSATNILHAWLRIIKNDDRQVTQQLDKCTRIGIEAQMRLKMHSIVYSTVTHWYGKTNIRGKAKYMPEGATGKGHSNNKSLSTQLGADKLKAWTDRFGGDTRIHDLYEAYRLAEYERVEYLKLEQRKK